MNPALHVSLGCLSWKESFGMEEVTPVRHRLLDRAGLGSVPGRHAFGNLATILRRGDVADTVELSEFAMDQARTSMAQPIRHDLVAQVRKQLADDTYLLDGMIDLALDRLVAKIAQP
jgi:hypothetical protein